MSLHDPTGRRPARDGWLWRPRAGAAAGLVLATCLSPTAGRTEGLSGAIVVAQAADRPVTIRGSIVSLDGSRLRVATAAGSEIVQLVPPVTVTGATRATLQDITPGTYLGTAARAQPDGSWRAIEVHIFAESMRGTGEGHRPMEAPGTSMTNASVDALVQRTDGPLLTLRHKDGVTQILVPSEAPIVRYAPGDTTLLIPGASIVVFRATRAADGTIRASRLTVGVEGMRLPM